MLKNALIMDKNRWESLQYNYHQMISSLNIIILVDENSFSIWKNRYLDDTKKEYPISDLKDYIRNIESLQEA